MTKKFLASTLRLGLLIILLAGLTFPTQYPVYALTTLTVQPLTWNVIGLDSNNVNVGPNHFPVGARVCNTGAEAATDVTATFVWDDGLNLYTGDPYINLRSGTFNTINLGTLSTGDCATNFLDFYFEVEIARDSNAYDNTREYHIDITAGNVTGTISTPQPREVYVEYLISQNRNAVTDIQYGSTIPSLTSVPPGGTMSLIVGNTYFIRLVGNTATQGYEQLESFINIPNVIFQTLSVSTTYTADTSAAVSSPNDKAYGDACVWENNPNSPNYRSCLSTGKVGGNITVTYQVRILQVPGAPLVNPAPLSSLIYDFSGSSYHYNADYGVSTRYAFILDPSTLAISKNFNPDPANAGGISTLTFTLTNPNAASVSGLNFTDTLPTTPGAMTVANPTNASTSGCGSPTFAPVAGAGSISFSNGTIAANSTCTIKLNVTVPVTGTYTNTSSNLFINSLDTGNSTTDPLTVNTTPPAPSPVCGLTMAQWTFAGFTIDPPPFPAPNTQAANVTTAAISVGNGLTAVADTSASGGNPQPGIRTYGWQNAGPIITLTSAYIQFAIDTSQYSQVAMQFDAQRKANGPNNDELYYSTNGTTWTLKSTFNSTTSWATYGAYDFTGQTNAAGVTYFRIYGYGANATSSGNDFNFDNVTFTGCATPVPPAITKAFSPNPIAINGTSTLTFTLSNSNSIALTGVTFTDSLPSGLQAAATPSAATTCGGTPTWAPTAGATSLTFGSPTGATIPASGSCTVSVNVTGTVDGSHQNVSGFISSTNGGTNTGSTGSASATLTVLKPPAISKLFAPNPILANGTSTLTFSISNPNLNNALTGAAFSDNYPAGVTNTNPLSTSNSCGGSLTLAAGGNSMSLSGGTVAAGGSCIITTTVTASSVGNYVNTSGAVSSTNGGTGNTASDTLTVNAPNPAIGILKQVSNSASGPWTSFLSTDIGNNVFYRLTIENTGDVALTNVSVNDPTVSTAGCSWVDGDGTVLGPAPISLPVADVNDNQIATCVLGPITAVEGINPNTATATGTYSATPYMDTSTATYGTTELTLDKTVAETSFNLSGDTLNYSYLVTNSGYAPLLGPVTVSDDKANVTCPAVSTAVQTAPLGPGDGDNYLDVGEQITCTAAYTVTLADVLAGSVTNTAFASADGVTSNSDSETIYRAIADLIVTKTNNVSGNVAVGNSFNWTITVDNTGLAAGVFNPGNVILSDTLPGVAGYYPQGALTVTNGGIAPIGTINCSITGTALNCVPSGILVTMPVGASFSVTFAVTPTAAGDLANTATVDPDGNVIELNETNNSDLDTVTVVGPPLIEKQFIPEIIAVGDTSTLTFTIFNTNTSTGLTGVSFTDSLPAGLQVANPPNASISGCGAPTFNSIAGDTTISFSGATIPETGSCTVSVDVIATTNGVKNNTTSNVTSTNGGTGNTASYTLTVFDAQPSKSIVTTSEPSTGLVAATERVTIGEMVRYRLATLIPEGSFINVQLLDGLPNGLQFLDDGTAMVAFVCNGGAACMSSSTLAGAGLIVSGNANAVSPTFVLPGSAITGGPFGTGTDVTFSFGDITNSDADADSEYIVVEFNALVLNVNTSPFINQGVDNSPGAASGSNGNSRINTATLSIDSVQVGSSSPNVTVSIAEPAITSITKSVAPATSPYLPGDSLTYTLLFNNIDNGNASATAFDIVLTDTFDANLTLGTVIVSSTQGATCAGGTTSSTGSSTVGQLLTVNVTCLDPGNSVTVTVNATIAGGTSSGTTIVNSSGLTYTSLPGAQGNCSSSPFTCTGVGTSGSGTGERDGSGGVGADSTMLNNYAVISNTVNTTVTAVAADLALTKVLDTAGPYIPGQSVDFTVTVTNNGPDTATGLNVTDSDTNLTVTNVTSATFTCAGNAFPCTLASLANGASATITVTATIDAGGTFDNTATVTSTSYDPNTVDNSDTDFDVTSLVDLSLNKQVSNAAPNVGDTITFTLVIANAGPSTATNIDVTDVVPSGYTYVTSSIAGGDTRDDVNPTTTGLTWTISSLASGDFVNLTYQATVLVSGLYDNYAEITDHYEPDNDSIPGNGQQIPDEDDDDTQTVTLINSDLALTKVLDTTGPFISGQSVQFTITVTNNGPDTATGLNVTDSDTNLTVTNVTSGTFTCTGGAFPCTLASLANGASATITVTATIDAVGDFNNSAAVTSTSYDPTPGNNTDNDGANATAPSTPPEFSKSFSPDTIFTGQVSTLTFTIDNTANTVAAIDMDFTDNLPGSVVVANPANGSTTCTGGTLTASVGAGVISYTGGSVSSGASCTVQANVTSASEGVYNNTTGDLTSSLGNSGTASDTLTVNEPENPVIGAAKDMNATGTGPWTVTIDYVFENFGNVALDNLTSLDDLSAVFGTAGVDWSFTSISSTPVAFVNPAYNGSTDTELIDQTPTQSLAVGGTASISVTITVNTFGTYNNQVTVYGDSPLGTTVNDDSTDGTDPDPNGNNTPDENTPTPLTLDFSDLSLTKTVDNSTPLVASNITFTITVTNANTSTIAATNVVVSDVIPAGFSYVGDNPSQGTYNSGTGDWSVGTLGIGASATLEITVSINVTGPYTNYAEITGVDQVDPDSTPGNNSTTEDDDDSVTVNPTQNNPSGLTKSISNSNQVFTTSPNVAIGEIVEYTVNVNIPPGVFTNSQMVDTMQRGLSFITCSSITPSNAGLTTDVAGSFASACSTPTVDDAGGGTTVDIGRRVTFDLDTLTNASGSDQTLTFVYTAVVLDSAANVSGVALNNSAAWSSDSGNLPSASAPVLIVEPDLSISKTANTSLVSVGSEVIITLTIQHTGNSETNAFDTVVIDVLPAELQYVPGSLNCTPGAQDPDVTCAESGGTITAEWSNFALGGGNGQVTFRVTVVSLPSSGISNVANVAWSSLPGPVGAQNSNVFSTERDYDPASNVDVYGVSDTLVIGVFNTQLPATGFAQNVVTDLGNTPSVIYQQTGGVSVEVPSLGINLPIVGVPLKNGAWDVSWLGNQAGWLNGSAFPTWSGNSVLTSHVYGSNGLPGPFVNLNTLKYGDKIVVHAYGQKYTYEVRTNTVVDPNNASVFAHEDKAWLTLVTCKEYDEKTNTYGKRVVVRAVLVAVGWE